MKAIISDIWSSDERTQVLGIIAQCNGEVTTTEETEGEVTAVFSNQDDVEQADIQLCDLGVVVDWEEED